MISDADEWLRTLDLVLGRGEEHMTPGPDPVSTTG